MKLQVFLQKHFQTWDIDIVSVLVVTCQYRSESS